MSTVDSTPAPRIFAIHGFDMVPESPELCMHAPEDRHWSMMTSPQALDLPEDEDTCLYEHEDRNRGRPLSRWDINWRSEMHHIDRTWKGWFYWKKCDHFVGLEKWETDNPNI